jgi:formiminoglutamase
MNFKNYRLPKSEFWTGRVDDPEDIDSFRIHQVVRFLDLTTITSAETDSSKINICILGFTCDEGVTRNMGRKGARQGAEYIRRAVANLPVTFGRELFIYDAGDIDCEEGRMEEAQDELKMAVQLILDHHFFPIVLGGGHELALGNYNGIIDHLENKATQKSSLGIINFDAHFDLRPHEKESSSGTMFSQIAESCKEHDRNFSYLCLGVQASGNTISLFKKADALGAKYILAKDFTDQNQQNISRSIQEFIDQHEQIYLTLCSDVFNSSFAPGVSAIQPFGMNAEVVLTYLKEIFRSKKVISFDVAEVSPRFDQDNRTAKLIAVIIFAIINILVENKKK